MRALLAGLLLAITVPAHVSAGPCNRAHVCHQPPVISMATAWMTGWETGAADAETNQGGGFSGSGLSFETSIVRTGSRSLKVAAVSGVGGTHAVVTGTGAKFARFYLRVTVRPASTARVIAGGTAVGTANLRLNANGTIGYYVASSLVGNSVQALTDTTRWYMVEYRFDSSIGVVLLRVEGIDEVSGTAGSQIGTIGANDTVADTYTAYFDDLTTDTAAFPGAGKVVLLLPTADSAVGSGWTNDAASATNIFNAVKNTPPVGIADTTGSTGLHQIRNASSATADYDATMATYSSAGITAADTVNAVQSLIVTGAPVTTGAKTGAVQIVSNPAEGAGTALTSNSGQFWTGTTAGTYPTGWKINRGAVTAAPSVTVGTAPVMRADITGGTASRIAMVCFMGMYVDYTPAAVAQVPYVNPMPPLLAQ